MNLLEPKPETAEGRSHPSQNKWGCVSAIAAAWFTTAVSVVAISRTGGSTAGFGFLYVPWVAGIAAITFFAFGKSLCQVVAWYRSGTKNPKLFPRDDWACCVTIGGLVAAFVGHGILLTVRVHWARHMAAEQIDRLDIAWLNKFVLAALVVNPQSSPDFLDRVSRLDNAALYSPMWSVWPVQPDNRWGLSVMRLVARRTDCLPQTFRRLSEGKRASQLTDDVLGNKAAPPDVLREMFNAAKSRGSIEARLAMHYLATNPAITQDLAEEIAISPDSYVRELLAGNPGIPESVAEALASDEEARVREALADNPSCPSRIKTRLRRKDTPNTEPSNAADSR